MNTELDTDLLDFTVSVGAFPNDGRMTDARFRTVRELLGLTGDWLATHLDVSPRTVRHWEQGKYVIPDGVGHIMQSLETRTAAFVRDCVETLTDLQGSGAVVYVYRNDAEFHAAHPGIGFPASWHRAVVARIALEVPALRISYTPTQERPEK